MIVPGVWGQLYPSGTLFSLAFYLEITDPIALLSDPVAPYFQNIIHGFAYISFRSMWGWSVDHNLKNADYARKSPHSGMLGSWAIVELVDRHDGNSTGKNYRSMLVRVHQHAQAMRKCAHSNQ